MGILMVTCPVTGDDFSTGIYIDHQQAETVRKIAVVSVYPANALSSALSKLAKVELSSTLAKILNGLALDRGAKYGVNQFFYGHGQAETARKIAEYLLAPQMRSPLRYPNWPKSS